MPANLQCIYCSSIVIGRGQGDHIIPRAFGEFRNDTRFRRICRKCNNLIGRCEEVLIRCSPEAICLELALPGDGCIGRRGRSYTTGAHGLPPPEVEVHIPEGKRRVERIGGGYAKALDQLVLYDKDGEAHPIRLDPKMQPDTLRRTVMARGIGEHTRMEVEVDENNVAIYDVLLRKAFPGIRLDWGSTTPAGEHTVQARITCRYDQRYFRAIAKMAFHYYLVFSRRSKGDEPAFRAIRNFIIDGGDQSLFFVSHGRFGLPPCPPGYAPANWRHFLAAGESEKVVMAYVNLFSGPRRPRGSEHHILLGRLATPLIVPRASWAHEYVYDSVPAHNGTVGEVHEVSLSRIR